MFIQVAFYHKNVFYIVMNNEVKWHAIRVTYSRELKFQSVLQDAGFETFIPMRQKKIERNGQQNKLLVPAISNLCFVKASYLNLRSFMDTLGEANPARFIWDKATGKPIIVPEKSMSDFIKVSLSMSDDILFLKEISQKLREGQKVRIKEGPFEGVEGIVVRVRKSRRVMVELPGMLAVTTSYIPIQELELI